MPVPTTLPVGGGDVSERRELLGRIAERVLVQERQVRIELRRPFEILAGSAHSITERFHSNPNHVLNARFSVYVGEKSSRGKPARSSPRARSKTGNPNHAKTRSHKAKTAALRAAISSWWACLESNQGPLHYQCNALTI